MPYNSIMQLRYATDDELTHWNDLIDHNPGGGNILQGREFASAKAKAGWTPRYITNGAHSFVALEKTLPLLGAVWYCPKGPSVESVDDFRSLLPELRSFARSASVFTVKIEPELDYATDMGGLGLIPTNPIQYNYSTVYVDLSPDVDEILASLNQKGRHAIRRAERDGVTVKKVDITDENCKIMYGLFTETAGDAGFAIRPPDYYRDFYRTYGNNGGLFFAHYEGEVVAGAFAMVQGATSMYKDGASVRARTAYGASHLLQWHVIQWAKEKGSLKHDLAGVPPIKDIKDPNHPFSGLARFKTSFNKDVTQYVGAFEVPIVQWKAKLWHRYIEKIVRKLYFKLRHESYY